MPTPAHLFPSSEDESVNLRLWTGILLPPCAAGIDIVVGYIVSNYDCNVHNRHLVLLVNLVTGSLCVFAALTSISARTQIEHLSAEEPPALLHSRRFMLRLGLWFSAGFLLTIIASTLSSFLLKACDL
jgi:hypothetical protein